MPDTAAAPKPFPAIVASPSPVSTDLAALSVIADYQFGAGAGTALFPATGEYRIDRTSSGRPQQIHGPTGRLVSYGTDGRFTLGVAGGRRLHAAFEPPACRVVVGAESRPYVREGRNAFAKFVRDVDPAVRSLDEVLVVDGEDTLLAVGRAELPADAMADLDAGVAVSVREGAAETETQ